MKRSTKLDGLFLLAWLIGALVAVWTESLVLAVLLVGTAILGTRDS